MRPSGRRELLRQVERSLYVFGAVCLGGFVAAHADSALYEALQNRRLDAALSEGPAPAGPSPSSVAPAVPGRAAVEPEVGGPAPDAAATAQPAAAEDPRPPAPGLPNGVVGRLELPRLGLRAIVAEGLDARTLNRAVGLVPGTARPGERGNVGLAGHRDRTLARLRGVQLGDRVRLVTPGRTYEYVVDDTAIVSPEAVHVLEATPEPRLTLVTCWPFSTIGPAPLRFVVRARQVS